MAAILLDWDKHGSAFLYKDFACMPASVHILQSCCSASAILKGYCLRLIAILQKVLDTGDLDHIVRAAAGERLAT